MKMKKSTVKRGEKMTIRITERDKKLLEKLERMGAVATGNAQGIYGGKV